MLEDIKFFNYCIYENKFLNDEYSDNLTSIYIDSKKIKLIQVEALKNGVENPYINTFNFEENFDDLLEKNYIKKGRGSGIVKAGDNYLADTTLDLLYELRK